MDLPFDTLRFAHEAGSSGRATYRPDWSRERPWALYIDGTAMSAAATRADAERYFQKKGFKPCPATV